MKAKTLLTIVLLLLNITYVYPNVKHSLSVSEIDTNDNPSNKILYYINLAESYSNIDLKKAKQYSEIAEKISNNNNDTVHISKLFHVKGMIEHHLGNYDESIKNHFKVIKNAEKNNNIIRKASSLNNIAIVFSESGEKENGINYFKKALLVFENINDSSKISASNLNLGSAYLSINDYILAEKHFIKAIKVLKLLNKDSIVLVKSLASLGDLYSKTNRIKEAKKFGLEALSISNDLDNNFLKAEAFLTMGEISIESKKYHQALVYSDSLLKYAHALKTPLLLKIGYKIKYKGYDGIGNEELSYKNYKIFIQYKDSIFDAEQRKQVLITRTKYEIEAKEQKIILLENDNKLLKSQKLIKKQNRYILIGGILALFVIAIFIYMNTQIKLKKSTLEKVILSNKLHNSNKELTNYALYIIQKNKMYDTIKDNLLKIKRSKSEGDKTKIIQDLILKLKNEIGLEKDMISFNEQLNKLESDFLHKMNKIHPNLTKKEKHLTTLLRLKFSSKEIASIVNISHNSVNVSRYRLRKKLNLKQDTELVSYLNEL